jgi:hypothetical protein
MFLALPAVLLFAANVQADVYDFSYVGVTDSSVFGSGTFTTGTPYGDGYVPIISITGVTEAGLITGLETSGEVIPGVPGVDPDSNSSLTCCAVGPPTVGGQSDFFMYDNAFMPNSPNPFSEFGLLFDVAAAGNGVTGYPTNPINLFGDENGGTYELSFGEDTPNTTPPAYGATPIRFTATLTPEPSFYGTVGLCLGGLVLTRLRRRRNPAKTV